MLVLGVRHLWLGSESCCQGQSFSWVNITFLPCHCCRSFPLANTSRIDWAQWFLFEKSMLNLGWNLVEPIFYGQPIVPTLLKVADKDIQDQDTWSNGQRNYWQWRTVLLVLSSVFLKPSPHHSWHPFLGDHQAPIWVHFPVAGQQWHIKLPKLSSAFLSRHLLNWVALTVWFKDSNSWHSRCDRRLLS